MSTSDASAAVTGACLCGAIRFRVEPPTLFCAHCHCSMCRRSAGAAYATWFGIVRERLTLLSGADALRRYRSSEHGTRSFCGRCGSSLFCESERHPEHVDVTLGSLDGPLDRAPAFHVYFDSRASWADVRDDLPRLGGANGATLLAGPEGEVRPGVAIGHAFLNAPDPEAAVDFFAALGMRVLEKKPDFGLLELRGGTHLLLFPGAAVAEGTPAGFDLLVDDLDAAHARFTAAGLAPSPIGPAPAHRAFTLRTPTGHTLTVLDTHVSGLPV